MLATAVFPAVNVSFSSANNSYVSMNFSGYEFLYDFKNVS